MNSELKDRVFNIPENVLIFLRQQKDIPELDRNENLLKTGQVTYGQLKRILHDLKKLNKNTNLEQYNFYGGDLMKNWGIMTLTNERNLINDRESATQIANDISGLSGERQNASRKGRTKNTLSPAGSLNLTSKPNSEKFSNASMFSPSSFKLTEEIKRIKKLMI
jgi:hypothetical protein